MKKKIFPGFALLLISLIVVSCVSRKDFDKAQSDLSAAQANVEGLEIDLEAAQNQIKPCRVTMNP